MFHDFHTFDLKVGPLRGFYSSSWSRKLIFYIMVGGEGGQIRGESLLSRLFMKIHPNTPPPLYVQDHLPRGINKEILNVRGKKKEKSEQRGSDYSDEYSSLRFPLTDRRRRTRRSVTAGENDPQQLSNAAPSRDNRGAERHNPRRRLRIKRRRDVE